MRVLDGSLGSVMVLQGNRIWNMTDVVTVVLFYKKRQAGNVAIYLRYPADGVILSM